MFKRHDKVLFIAQIIFWIGTAFIALGSIIGGIWGAVVVSPWYIFTIFGGLLASFFYWVFTTLFISFLKDIKLIRNKLYREGIEGLKIKDDKQKEKTVKQKEKIVEQEKKIIGDPYEE